MMAQQITPEHSVYYPVIEFLYSETSTGQGTDSSKDDQRVLRNYREPELPDSLTDSEMISRLQNANYDALSKSKDTIVKAVTGIAMAAEVAIHYDEGALNIGLNAAIPVAIGRLNLRRFTQGLDGVKEDKPGELADTNALENNINKQGISVALIMGSLSLASTVATNPDKFDLSNNTSALYSVLNILKSYAVPSLMQWFNGSTQKEGMALMRERNLSLFDRFSDSK